MTDAERNEVQSKIIIALRKLIPDAEEKPGLGEMWIESGIGVIMAYVAVIHGDRDLNWRRPAGRRKVQKELKEIADLYRNLSQKMDAVHQPTHEMLSAVGVGPFFERTRCENFIKIIADLDASELPANVGRGQSKMREKNVADRLAIMFSNVTGQRPTIAVNSMDNQAYGRFIALVEEVFEVAQIDASAEDCARRAVETFGTSHGEKGG